MLSITAGVRYRGGSRVITCAERQGEVNANYKEKIQCG